MKWVIVFTTGNGYPVFAEDENDKPCLFDSEKQAEETANSMPISVQWPFVVVELA